MRATAYMALAVLMPAAATAQQRADSATRRPPGRTIVGVVTDTADRVVDSAEVFLPALKRTTAADTAGHFRFDDVKPGEYQVAARRLGFFPQTRTVTVTKDSGGVVRFALVPNTRGLPPVVTSARRGGLSGVVGDTAWRAIKGAEITAGLSGGRAVSDSMGTFFIDLRPGKHMVRVKREGYASQLVSVTVPRDSGRRMMVFLTPSTRPESVLEENAIFDMGTRLARRNAVYSTLFTREDINKGPWTELYQIAQAGSGRPLQPNCLALVNGGPKQEYLWAIRASEIEAVEIYRERPRRMQMTSIVGGGRPIGNTRAITNPVAGGDCQGNAIYVWLRK